MESSPPVVSTAFQVMILFHVFNIFKIVLTDFFERLEGISSNLVKFNT